MPRGRLTRRLAGRCQRGAAIVTAMLVVMLATTVVAGLMWRAHVSVRSVENQLALGQAHWIARAVIDWARVVLMNDRNAYDSYTDVWGPVIENTLIDETMTGGAKVGDDRRSAVMAGQILDAQGRLNLTSMGTISEKGLLYQAAFARLLELIGQPASLASGAADRIRRSRTQGSGAEQTAATELPLIQLSDLRYVPGFDASVISAIEPYVTILPVETAVNLNTAPAPVIASLSEGLSPEKVAAIATPTRAFATSASALQAFGLDGTDAKAQAALQSMVSIKSDWFLVRGVIRFDRVQEQSETLLHRQSTNVEIVWQRRY